MDETPQSAEYPSRSLPWSAEHSYAQGDSVSSLLLCCRHRTEPWPHLGQQHLAVSGDVPERKRGNSSMGCSMGALHVLSASSKALPKAQEGAMRRDLHPPRPGENVHPWMSQLWRAPGTERSQRPQNHGIVWGGKDP